MKKDYLHLKRVHKLSKADMQLGIPLYQKILKISEESGEVAQAFLEYEGALNVSASASTKKKEKELLSELYDVMNCAMDAINHITNGNKKLQKKMVKFTDKKLDKWEDKQKKYLQKKKRVKVVDSKMEFKPTKMFPKGEVVFTQIMSDGSTFESGGGPMGNDW